MDINNLVLYSEPLYKIAYKKLNNTVDADELTQETLLQALIELRKDPNKVINNEQAWLNGILNNCYYTMMRKKYKISYVTFDVVIENLLFDDNINDFIDDEETREVHNKIQRAVSGLAKIHRDVIYMFYMQNKSVNQIAEELNIPRGTVLSRLDNGRKMIKKGVEKMNKNIMYQPQKLNIGINGKVGDNNEPFSNISTKIHQNILLLAYEKPINENEISERTGIPCVYIEEIVENLIKAELMKRTSNGKVYTDFYINFENDRIKNMENMLDIVNDKFTDVWNELSNIFNKLFEIDFVSEMSENHKNKLSIYVGIKLFINVIGEIRYEYQQKPFTSFNEFPDRPNNGKWVVIGNQMIDENKLNFYEKYSYSGALSSNFVYKGVWIKCEDFQTSFGDTHHKYPISANFAKFLYDLKTNDISPENEKYLKDIPILCELDILDNNNGTTQLNIPQLRKADEESIGIFINDNQTIHDILKKPLFDCFEKQHAKLPAHLKDSVLPEFLTLYSIFLATGFLVTAKEKGLFLNGVDYPCPAMIFVTE